MVAYFYSFKIISKFGHIKILALGLLCNVIRFIYISFITWPWLILPFEFVQGKPGYQISTLIPNEIFSIFLDYENARIFLCASLAGLLGGKSKYSTK